MNLVPDFLGQKVKSSAERKPVLVVSVRDNHSYPPPLKWRRTRGARKKVRPVFCLLYEVSNKHTTADTLVICQRTHSIPPTVWHRYLDLQLKTRKWKFQRTNTSALHRTITDVYFRLWVDLCGSFRSPSDWRCDWRMKIYDEMENMKHVSWLKKRRQIGRVKGGKEKRWNKGTLETPLNSCGLHLRWRKGVQIQVLSTPWAFNKVCPPMQRGGQKTVKKIHCQ